MRSWVIICLLIAGAPAFADARDDEARDHFNKGSTAYDLSRFSDAAKEFEAAYEIKNEPALLFNIAQAYRFSGNYEKALLAYKAFLRKLPDSSQRPQVERTVDELQQLVDEQKNAKSHPPAGVMPQGGTEPSGASQETHIVERSSAPALHKTPIYKKWWLWTAVGGVVAVGVGVGLAFGLPNNAPYPSGTQTVSLH